MTHDSSKSFCILLFSNLSNAEMFISAGTSVIKLKSNLFKFNSNLWSEAAETAAQQLDAVIPCANWKGLREQFLLFFSLLSLQTQSRHLAEDSRGSPLSCRCCRCWTRSEGWLWCIWQPPELGRCSGLEFPFPCCLWRSTEANTFDQMVKHSVKRMWRERERKIWWIYCHSAEIWRADDNKLTVNSVTWTGLNVKTSDLAGDSELKTGNRSLISWLGPHNLHTNTFSPVECHWSLRGLAANFSAHGASNLHLLAF